MKQIMHNVNVENMPPKQVSFDIQHVKNLWEALTAKYGFYELKAGQSEAAEKQFWATILKEYTPEDLIKAGNHYMTTAKKDLWPTAVQIKDILQNWGARKIVKNALPAPQHFQDLNTAKKQSADWFNNWLAPKGNDKVQDFTYLVNAYSAKNREKLSKFKDSKLGFVLANTVIALMWQEGIPQQFERENK